MAYDEEKEFTFRIELVRRFSEDYQGEDDGFAWVPGTRPILSDMLHALVQVAQKYPGWKIRPRNRGRSSDDEVTLVLEKED